MNRAVREYGLRSPDAVLNKTRELVIGEFAKSEEDVRDGMDISLCKLSTDEQKKEIVLEWAGANNPLWIVRKDDAKLEDYAFDIQLENGTKLYEIKGDKQPIGQHPEEKPFQNHKLHLKSGDIIYVFTDGYQDQFGGDKGKKFKASKLKELILSISDKEMNDQKNILHQTIQNWRGTLEQLDDICIIGVRV